MRPYDAESQTSVNCLHKIYQFWYYTIGEKEAGEMYDNRASDNVYLNRRALNYSNRPIPNRLLLPKRSYKFMIYSELKGN